MEVEPTCERPPQQRLRAGRAKEAPSRGLRSGRTLQGASLGAGIGDCVGAGPAAVVQVGLVGGGDGGAGWGEGLRVQVFWQKCPKPRSVRRSI